MTQQQTNSRTLILEVLESDVQFFFSLLQETPFKIANPILQRLIPQVEEQLGAGAKREGPAEAVKIPRRTVVDEPERPRPRGNGVDRASGHLSREVDPDEAADALAER